MVQVRGDGYGHNRTRSGYQPFPKVEKFTRQVLLNDFKGAKNTYCNSSMSKKHMSTKSVGKDIFTGALAGAAFGGPGGAFVGGHVGAAKGAVKGGAKYAFSNKLCGRTN